MTALFIGCLCFALHTAVSLVWLRLPRGPSPVVRHAVSALGTHLLGVGVGAWLVGPFAYWPAAAVSGFTAVAWLFAFSAVYKSVSLRILTQLDRTPGHALSVEAITDRYVRPEFEARVAVLVAMGCAEAVEGGYALTGKGNESARRVAVIQRVCGIEVSGLYGEVANPDREGRGGPLPHGRGSPRITPPVP